MAKSKPRYPFKTMTVGGKSFSVPVTDKQKLKNAASNFVKDSEPDWKFKVIDMGSEITCFRTA